MKSGVNKVIVLVSRCVGLLKKPCVPSNPKYINRKKSTYSVYVYGALDVRLFPNKRLNVDLKNIEIWVSHGLKKSQ